MTRMKPIYIDVDDVLSETAGYFADVVGREFGKSVSIESIHSFDLKESFGLTQAEYDEFFKIVHHPDQILCLEPVDGAVEVISRWADAGCTICIITGRPTSVYDATIQWLLHHKIPYHSLLMVDKYGRAEANDPAAITLDELAKMQFCLAIEDSADVARFITAHMDTPVALFDRPWNRSATMNGKISRYGSWQEIEDGIPVSALITS